jgi:hypothetical protein
VLRLLVWLVLFPAALGAQVVRGTITERGSDTPVSGVIVSLVDAQGVTTGQVLTNEEGTFEIRAPGPGSFSLDIKRIGVRRARLDPFSIAAGETLRRDVIIDPVPVVIPSMRVTASSSCLQRPAENERTAALWEEAHAALTATVVARTNRRSADSVVRFMRKLDVTTWRVLFEQRNKISASMDRPFRSLPADDLSRGGYVRVNADGSADYYAPDADVLLSEPFLVDHCFRVERGSGPHAQHVGLAFEPVSGRRTPDIRGVLWLDRSTAELRSLEFSYTWLPHDARRDDFGGVVDFFRTLAGRWIVRNWRIRLPEFGYERWLERANGERVPLAPSRTPRVVRILEEGGAVPITALLSESGTVRGTVMVDSVRRQPVEGATVLLAGTSSEAVSDAAGRFAIPFVPPGSYTIVLRHAALDSLGLEHLATTVEVGTGTVANLVLTFPSLGELAMRLCTGQPSLDRAAVVRIIVTDSAGRPLANSAVVVSRRGGPAGVTGADTSVVMHEGPLDAQGAYVACGIPDGAELRVESGSGVTPPWASSARVTAGAVGWHHVRVPRG